MQNNNASNVSVGKPKVGGSIKIAPVGTTLPTDAVSELDAAFENLGFVSDAGLTNNTNMESESIKEWGGSTVLMVQTSKEDTFQYALLEVLNPVVAKHVFGDENVSGDLTNGISIVANNAEHEEHSIVIDMILNNNVLKRIVIPKGKVTQVDAITYVNNQAIAYNTTLFCAPDNTSAEATHYEYMQTKPFVVTFNSNGGSDVDSQNVVNGGKVTEPDAPTKTGYTFDAWYSDEDLTDAWTFATDTVTANMTLYAKWTS